MNHKIHPAAEAFPMLGTEELQELSDDIKANGLREPIWMYDDPEHGRVLLDGRNRMEACRIAGVDPVERDYDGSDPVAFIVSQNVHRRHMSAGQRAAAADKLAPYYADDAKKRQREAGGDRKSEEYQKSVTADRREAITEPRKATETNTPAPPKPEEKPAPPKPAKPPRHEHTAASQAAKSVGASGRAVERYQRIKREAPDLLPKIDADEMSLDRADRIIRDRHAEARKVQEAKQQAQAVESDLTVDIRHGDFREVLSDLTGIDAIITDPPYPKEYLPLLDDLAAFADRVLTPEGVMAVLIGQSHLPEVYQRLSGGRPYRWTACYYTPGSGYAAHQAKVQSNWKPVLVYGKGPRFSDVVRSDGGQAGQSHHKWGQDYTAFYDLIARLTTAEQTVVDPFMGAGTTWLAAHAQGRHCVGCDVEQESVEKAKERLS